MYQFLTRLKRHPQWVFLFATILTGCAASSVYISSIDRSHQGDEPPRPEELKHEVYLIGNAGGYDSSTSEPALSLLKTFTDNTSVPGTIVFLGDNVYCCGLPDSASSSRPLAEMRLLAQLDAVRNYSGRIVIIPGNRDWGGESPQRVELVNRQEEFVETNLGRDDVFLPGNGLPGPVDIKLEDGLRLVVMDTQWWMTDAAKPYGDSDGADIEEDADLILELDEILTKRRKDDLLIVGHHPIRSNGRHGGKFSPKDNLFPLTALVDNLYIPLPIIGSLYPILRRTAGAPQDFSNPDYQSFRQALDALFLNHEGRLIYAASHEHNLQYFREAQTHHIVSGAGSKTEYVAPGGDARFTSTGEGFMRIRFYEDGEMWLEAWTHSESDPDGELVYHAQMDGPKIQELDEPIVVDAGDIPHIRPDSTVRLAPDTTLTAGSLHEFFMGSEHREAWATEVDFPVFDIGAESGGLTPVRRGGSLQTTSVRLQDLTGKQFVLRSVNKDPTRSLPPELRETLAATISIDQIAVMHPYAALIVPKLADGAGVYHSNPKLVVVPDDPRFGPYRDVVADRIMLFEERPDEDMSHAPSYGRTENVIGTVSMLKNITADNDVRVDELSYARARLFDMYLSDWDRHSDQWRWAEFNSEDGNGTVYGAIPRDRDWAFSKMNGIFPTITKSRYVLPKMQDFRESFGYLRGLNGKGIPFDRRFTTSLTRDDWVRLADEMQSGLTDDVIDAALKDWPEPIQDLYADNYRHLLKVRRDKLTWVANEYYELISRFPDVVGSNKHERFEIRRLSDDRTEVVMYKTSKDGEIRKELFRRTFHGSETDEVRLYGLGGNDVFVVSGDEKGGVRVRAIGGTGPDQFIDNSGPASRGKSFIIYDVPFETQIQLGPSVSVQVSDDPLVNRYDIMEYGYPDFMPALSFGSNQDDGLFIGGGGTFTRYSFRRYPFDHKHSIIANFSAKTQAFNIEYEGLFTDRLKDWDIGIEAAVRTPNNIRNFYGLGNETDNTEDDAEFYWARYSEAILGLQLIKNYGEFLEFFVGPRFEYNDIEEDSTRFVGTPQAGVASSSFQDQSFLGIESGFVVDSRDSPVFSRQGFLWNNTAHFNQGLNESSTNFIELASDFSFYLTPASNRSHTLAARVGIRHNIGDFPFYRSSSLGGEYNLRGWRSTRFAGRTAFYQNLEIRTQLFKYSTLLAVGSAGMLAFIDNGRVWTDAESSSKWHQGYGVGLWANLFNMSVLTASVNFSEEETTLIIGFGFFY